MNEEDLSGSMKFIEYNIIKLDEILYLIHIRTLYKTVKNIQTVLFKQPNK